MSQSNQKAVQSALFEVVENQIRDREPRETKETYDRLIGDGHGHDETMRLLSYVVLCETNDCRRESQPFDVERFVDALHSLPEVSES